ncbi:MAG TPA: DNA topoisomerase IB [Polyangiaceae bacterium]|nr:DNA topoisomerase IB [Polyangiaceae bacterium]
MPAAPATRPNASVIQFRRLPKAVKLLHDSEAAAQEGGLVHLSAEELTVLRRKSGKGFSYVTADGRAVKSPSTLARIRSLAIPPAWTDVRIASNPRGHLQCTGHDARGRKQYRYHPRFREVRDLAKYHEIVEFATELPKLRRAIERDLASPALTKDKVVATILRIMDRTSLRVGNDRYARDNASFGLTTLKDRHAQISGRTVAFSFRGKGGKDYRASIRDRKLAAIVKRCRDIPGQRLFQYLDANGRHRGVTSTDVNAYIRNAMGRSFTAKEFRTWSATVHATVFLHECVVPKNVTHRRKSLLSAIDRVAEHLGNTRAICRKSYIHPLVIDAYESDKLTKAFARCLAGARPPSGLRREECAVLSLLGSLSRATVRAAA